MPVINRIAAFADEMATWRRHLHAHPEVGFDCHDTAAFVAARLRDFGVDEIHEGIAKSGLVAIINGQGGGKHNRPARGYGCVADNRGLWRTMVQHAARQNACLWA